MSEFEAIRRFAGRAAARSDVRVGSGDDGAVVAVPDGHELVLTTDTLVAGRHFPEETKPADIGWKALAVNLSDLAAMGAEPAWVTVALTVPRVDPAWMDAFADGLFPLLEASGAALVGGDLTRGPLSVTVQAAGLVPMGRAITRSGAQAGDIVAVTGTLGDAALALDLWRAGAAVPDVLRRRLDRPTPRIEAGAALRGIAHAVIDVSDGLAADLGHILSASRVGATVELASLPRSAEFTHWAAGDQADTLPLTGGDDYELCVCMPPDTFESVRARLDCALTAIGTIETEAGLRVVNGDGAPIALGEPGFDHFE